jgi:hypothetical protein
MVRQRWCLGFRCCLINSNFFSCNYRLVSLTIARRVVWFRIEERRPDVKGCSERTEYLVAYNRQGVVLQLGILLEVLATLHSNNLQCSATFHNSSTWTDPWARGKEWKTDMRFGSWNVKRLYRANYLMSVAKELVKFRLDLVGVYYVRWEKRYTVLADD